MFEDFVEMEEPLPEIQIIAQKNQCLYLWEFTETKKTVSVAFNLPPNFDHTQISVSFSNSNQALIVSIPDHRV